MWEGRGGFLYLPLYNTVHSSRIKHLLGKSWAAVAGIHTSASLSRVQSGWACQVPLLDKSQRPHKCVGALGYLRHEHIFFTALEGFDLVFAVGFTAVAKHRDFSGMQL